MVVQASMKNVVGRKMKIMEVVQGRCQTAGGGVIEKVGETWENNGKRRRSGMIDMYEAQ